MVVTYTLNNQGQLGIHYKATNNDTKLSTVLNLTNHSYFNLAGEASAAGSAYRQFVQINANNYSPTDTTQIPLPLPHGVPVAGTPFDFRAPHTIGSRISDVSAPDNVPAQFASHRGREPAAHRAGLRPQLDPEPADRRDHRSGWAEPGRPRLRPVERPCC